jgi:hypothetical protein
MMQAASANKQDASKLCKRRLETQDSETKLPENCPTQQRLKQPRLKATSKCKPQRSAVKPATSDGDVQAARRYEELQDSLQQVYWDCNEIWRSSIMYDKEGPSKTWRAAMEDFQGLVNATLTETLILGRPCLERLSNAAALLWKKIQRTKSPHVLRNHVTHLQDVMQATSEQVCCKIILNELLSNKTLTEIARREQASYLTSKLHNASIELQAAIERAQSYAVMDTSGQNPRRRPLGRQCPLSDNPSRNVYLQSDCLVGLHGDTGGSDAKPTEYQESAMDTVPCCKTCRDAMHKAY